MAKANPPAAKFRLGYVTATVWLNNEHYNTVLSKSYHNRKLRPLHALDLDPRVAAFRPVRGIGFFRDNSFEPQLARVREQERPVRHKMVGVQDGARYSRLV